MGQDLIDDEVSYFVTECTAVRDAAQPDHREAVIVFWGNAEAGTRTEYNPQNYTERRQ